MCQNVALLLKRYFDIIDQHSSRSVPQDKDWLQSAVELTSGPVT